MWLIAFSLQTSKSLYERLFDVEMLRYWQLKFCTWHYHYVCVWKDRSRIYWFIYYLYATCSTVLLPRLVTFPALYRSRRSITAFTRKKTNGPSPEPDESSQLSTTLFPEDPSYKYYIPINAYVSQAVLSFRFSHQTPQRLLTRACGRQLPHEFPHYAIFTCLLLFLLLCYKNLPQHPLFERPLPIWYSLSVLFQQSRKYINKCIHSF